MSMPVADRASEIHDTDEAILMAMAYLSDWVAIHDGAPRGLDGINTAPQAKAWGRATWRGLRALAAFAEDRAAGYQRGFYDWCRSGAPHGWPATAKKVSLSESATVQTTPKLAAARRLPVSTEVDPSGRITMWSHLKIAAGGGDLAPRVYFYDDTNGSTQKIHVGFIGPHYLMRNTKS